MTKEETQQFVLKPLFTAFLVPVTVGAGGAWIGVEVSIARIEERLAGDEKIIVSLHERIQKLEAMNTDHATGPLSEHREFRERITRLEEQVRILQNGRRKE